MKELTPQQLKEVKAVRNLAFVPFALLAAFHIFMVYYIFPMEDNFMRIYVASRAGGSAHYLTTDQFATMSTILMVTAALVGLLIFTVAQLKMRKSTLLVGFLLFSATTFYLSIYLAAALEEFWGGWGQLIGVVASLAIWLGLVWPIMTSGLPPRSKKSR